MGERKIKSIESTSIGKTSRKNDDGIYTGENFVAVIDGVSHKSTIKIDGKEIKIANIITEAIKKIDSPSAPVYAKELTFEEFVIFINMYIKKYLDNMNFPLQERMLEATGAIYSKYYNQIWLVGDCRAIYDKCALEHELKIDKVYEDIRAKVIETLLEAGYTQEQLLENDISKPIIANSEDIPQYIKNEQVAKELQEYITDTMKQTLLHSGFTEQDITEQHLLEKYNNPRKLQEYLKNNPNAGEYGYSVFNGIKTEPKNCRVQDLPKDVKKIKLFSDGFPTNILNNDKDLGYAIRQNRKLAQKDPLGINENKTVRNAVRQSEREKFLAIDDYSAVCFKIEYLKERDDERQKNM